MSRTHPDSSCRCTLSSVSLYDNEIVFCVFLSFMLLLLSGIVFHKCTFFNGNSRFGDTKRCSLSINYLFSYCVVSMTNEGGGERLQLTEIKEFYRYGTLNNLHYIRT